VSDQGTIRKINSPCLSGNHQEKTALAYQGTIRKKQPWLIREPSGNEQPCMIREPSGK
jgi:hypothetical protein